MAKKHMRPTTNDEAIAQLMDLGKSGPLVQMFVIDALTKMADAVAGLTDEEAHTKLNGNGLVHPVSWRNAARDVKTTLDKHFAGQLLVPMTVDEDDE